MPRKINWENPQALIYESNYAYGMNFYQPMIDYIDAKDNGTRTNGYPHLPWTDKYALAQYSPRKPVRCYSEEDLATISRRTEARAKTKLKDFKSTTKSRFQLSKSVSAASITKQVHTEVKKTKKNKLVAQIDKIKSRMADHDDHNADLDSKVVEGLKSAQKYLRGRSAKGIEAQLLSESYKNVSEGVIRDIDIKKYQRNAFVNTYSCSAHAQLMTKRMQTQLDESFSKPLDELSHELKGFDKKTSAYFLDKRWRCD